MIEKKEVTSRTLVNKEVALLIFSLPADDAAIIAIGLLRKGASELTQEFVDDLKRLSTEKILNRIDKDTINFIEEGKIKSSFSIFLLLDPLVSKLRNKKEWQSFISFYDAENKNLADMLIDHLGSFGSCE